VSDALVIQAHAGPYRVDFDPDAFRSLDAAVPDGVHFVIDANVARLYRGDLSRVLASPSVLVVEASETSKSLERFPAYVEHLVSRRIRRHHRLVAIGGGVLQDITCFLAAVMLRGIPWEFYPTTLLAQADSCIGSKSSVNVGSAKNILGTFTPPVRIAITTRVLQTLSDENQRSGIGEMLKVHAIAGPAAFDEIANDYSRLRTDSEVLERYIRRALEIKQRIIETDEFDRGARRVMNYGHSFGHAIEVSTAYAIPHGIAVTIGMDMANHVATRFGMAQTCFERMHPVLRANYGGFERTPVPIDLFLEAIGKDKKNTDRQLSLVLPDAEGMPKVTQHPADARFVEACTEYLTAILPS
jgi:3-dehydroquinate synthase